MWLWCKICVSWNHVSHGILHVVDEYSRQTIFFIVWITREGESRGNVTTFVALFTNLTLINFTIVWPCIVTDSLWIKPTDALNSNFIGITTLHVSGSLSACHQEFLAVHRLWYILCSCDDCLLPGVGWNILLLVANGHHNYYYSQGNNTHSFLLSTDLCDIFQFLL